MKLQSTWARTEERLQREVDDPVEDAEATDQREDKAFWFLTAATTTSPAS